MPCCSQHDTICNRSSLRRRYERCEYSNGNVKWRFGSIVHQDHYLSSEGTRETIANHEDPNVVTKTTKKNNGDNHPATITQPNHQSTSTAPFWQQRARTPLSSCSNLHGIVSLLPSSHGPNPNSNPAQCGNMDCRHYTRNSFLAHLLDSFRLWYFQKDGTLLFPLWCQSWRSEAVSRLFWQETRMRMTIQRNRSTRVVIMRVKYSTVSAALIRMQNIVCIWSGSITRFRR